MWNAPGAPPSTAALLTALALGLTACGDDDGDKTTASEPATTSAQASAPDLVPFLMRKGEEPGFRPGAAPGATPTKRFTLEGVKAFAADMKLSSADVKRLREEGFIAFTAEPIRGPNDAAGVTNAAVFETADGAEHNLAYETRTDVIKSFGPVTGLERFDVPGVPGARGWTASQPPVGNVYWAQGRCVLVLGNQGPGDLTGPLTKGVQAIYKRTNGECP